MATEVSSRLLCHRCNPRSVNPRFYECKVEYCKHLKQHQYHMAYLYTKRMKNRDPPWCPVDDALRDKVPDEKFLPIKESGFKI